MSEAPSSNTFGAKSTLISHSFDAEFDAWDNWLPPEIRKFIVELPIEFSAVEALRAYREIRQYHIFESQGFIIREFKNFMELNIERVRAEMRKEDGKELHDDAPMGPKNIVDKYIPIGDNENAPRNIQDSEGRRSGGSVRRDKSRSRFSRRSIGPGRQKNHYFAL